MQRPKSGRIVLVIGGARSGKSRLAGRLAETSFRHPLYLATAEARDREMTARIAAHRRERGPRWSCVEEPLAIADLLRRPPKTCDGILVDCLTLWLTNVLLREGADAVARRRQELLAALAVTPRDVILVSNEVGLGIVPSSRLGRQFRDLAGWLNQDLAAAADAVVFVAAGLPLLMKNRLNRRPSVASDDIMTLLKGGR